MDKREEKSRRGRRRKEEKKEEGKRKEDQRFGTCMDFYGLVWKPNYGFVLILVCSISKV